MWCRSVCALPPRYPCGIFGATSDIAAGGDDALKASRVGVRLCSHCRDGHISAWQAKKQGLV